MINIICCLIILIILQTCYSQYIQYNPDLVLGNNSCGTILGFKYCHSERQISINPKPITLVGYFDACRESGGNGLLITFDAYTSMYHNHCSDWDTSCVEENVWPDTYYPLNVPPAQADCTMCEMSNWSSWKTCSSCNSMTERSRYIITPPAGLNDLCPSNLQSLPCLSNVVCNLCILSDWSEWSICHNSEGSSQMRTRQILNSNPCEINLSKTPLKDTKLCIYNPKKCNEELAGTNGLLYRGCQKFTRSGQECVNWLDIDFPAFNYLASIEYSGIGNHNYCRNPISNSSNVPTIWCYVSTNPLIPQLCDPIATDCVISDWSQWSSCSSTCNQGQITRTRIIQTPPYNGGKPCPSELSQSQDCFNNIICPINCEVSSWSKWSECSAQCGDGSMIRSRSIITQPSGNGIVCPDLQQLKACKGTKCGSFWEKNKISIVIFSLLLLLLVVAIIYIIYPSTTNSADIYGNEYNPVWENIYWTNRPTDT
ncbi:thrombospondin type 1 domain-containing protein [Cryptosporidium andersoni]|uniref:Thrombospondin type 1 domain-containing protein n=1 Tax=Cryptosporidium andersoni TaxID=117008 RepID=A0A1J4MXN5_9CRYT|nr:thrombospondin type 1 domain-containing protein [Cryptosporidium andersoni]